MHTVALFIDVQNIYYTVKQQYNSHFDYTVFRKETIAGRKLKKAFAYATDKGDDKQRNFQNILKQIGFEVRLIPFIQRSDGSTKGDWDVGIAMDILEYAKQTDIIVLASGDGDYTPVIKKVIENYHTTVEVYGVAELTAMSLIQAASSFFPIKGNLLLPIPWSW